MNTYRQQMEQRRRGESSSYEQSWRRKDGAEVATIISPQALIDVDGTWHGSFAVVTDISDRKRAEAALRESEERYRQLIEMSPIPIVVHCQERILFANPAAVNVLGGTVAADLVDRSIWDVVHEESIESVRKRVVQLYEKRGPAELAEEKFVRLDGELIDVECVGTAVDFAGRPSGQVVFRDVTARKRVEAERAALAEQLNQAQKMEAVGQLAGGVAHDFNNLLTVITARVEQVRETDLNAEEAEVALRAIEEAVEQASGVTKALLTFSHKLPTDKGPVNLAAVVTKSAQLLKRLLPASIEMQVEADCDPPPWVHADGTQLQQVVLNLAINARDAMADGGTLRLRVARAAAAEEETLAMEGCRSWPAAILRISDTGVGMSPDVQKRACEPFFTTKDRGQGTGLGLAIVHGIVRDHGGCLRIESTPGHGTTVSVALPMVEPTHQTEAVSEPAVPRGNGETLLLAEDNRHAREIMASQLISLGYEVIAVATGQAARDAYRTSRDRVALLILDIDLPLLSGVGCLAEIRDAGSRVPAILITGSVDARVEENLDSETALLRKPFNMAKLGHWAAKMLRPLPRQERET